MPKGMHCGHVVGSNHPNAKLDEEAVRTKRLDVVLVMAGDVLCDFLDSIPPLEKVLQINSAVEDLVELLDAEAWSFSTSTLVG